MGLVVKCHAVYNTPFWRARGLSGQAISRRGPVGVVFDNSPPGGPGVLVAFVEGAAVAHFADRGPAQRREIVIDCRTRLFGPEAGTPTAYLDQDWTA